MEDGGRQMKCFYHRDNDGKCAGAIVKMKYGPQMECIGIDYQDKFPFETIEKNEIVYIVDYSIEPPEMGELLSITKNVHWIDHHKTAIEKYGYYSFAQCPDGIKGIRKVGKAGCRLTWEYLYPKRTIPWAVILIEDWDVWNHHYGERTMDFNAGLNGAENSEPDSAIWIQLLEPEPLGEPDEHTFLMLICSRGHTINIYNKKMNKDFVKQYGYTIRWKGHEWMVINKPKASSIAFESISGEYDFFISYVYDGLHYIVSLYTDKKGADLTPIAKKYGGGGHPGACGFVCEELPW
jgi:oligoribonuclease NrnB/cAMP/cGMP phosphodiesterase (DHH superfamily)